MFFILLVLCITSNLAGIIAARVNTTTGQIIGHPANNRSEVIEYLGIPYAQPPIGTLRFAAPQKLIVDSDRVFIASNWSSDCPANIAPPITFPNFTGNGAHVYGIFTGHTNNTQSEDCLALNIWVPANASSSSPKPVVIFFHGGRYTIPGPHSPFYNGQYLAAEQDIIVVTIGYRLNIFGFSGAPGLPQNAGMLDQRAAVEWLYSNVASFGGNNSLITIMGQSAGAASVDSWAYAYRDSPLVAGLISISGTALSFTPNNASYSLSSFYNASGTLGCGNASDPPEEVVSCMRSQNMTALLAAAAKAPPLPSLALPQPVFHPTVDNVTVFGDYAARSAAGEFTKIPYLLGNADYEAGFYRLSAYLVNKTLSDAQWDAFNAAGFTCPAATEATARAREDVSVWRYRYFGDWEVLRLYEGSGAYHGSDLSLLFGTVEDVSGESGGEVLQQTARYLRDAWAAFVRNPETGLDEFGWPKYEEDGETLVRLAYANETRASFVDPNVYDEVCPAVNDPSPAQGAF